MNPIFTNSLWITLISMGLVFASLLLLAGLMSALTRLFQDQDKAIRSSTSRRAPGGVSSGEPAAGEGGKERAAALAVAVALAGQAQSTARPIVPPPPAIIGAWQLGMRTRHMTQKSGLKRRR